MRGDDSCARHAKEGLSATGFWSSLVSRKAVVQKGEKNVVEMSVFLDDETGDVGQVSGDKDLAVPLMFLDCRLTKKCAMIRD